MMDHRQQVTQELTGQEVITTYNKRVYKIDDVAFDLSPESTFKMMHDGEEFNVSFSDYLRNRHKVEVTDTN